MVTQESTSERTLAEEITLLMEALPAQEEAAKAAIKEMTSAEPAQILGMAKGCSRCGECSRKGECTHRQSSVQN